MHLTQFKLALYDMYSTIIGNTVRFVGKVCKTTVFDRFSEEVYR